MEPRHHLPTALLATAILTGMALAFKWPGTFWGLDFHTYLPVWGILLLIASAFGLALLCHVACPDEDGERRAAGPESRHLPHTVAGATEHPETQTRHVERRAEGPESKHLAHTEAGATEHARCLGFARHDKGKTSIPHDKGKGFARHYKYLLPTLAAIAFGLLCYLLPIRTQLYGDTMAILKTLGKNGVFEQQYHLSGAFSPNIFTSKNGEQFTYSLALGLSKGIGWEIGQSFRILTSLFGACFAFVWVRAVLRWIPGNTKRVLAAAIGLTAGATQVFYGHPEVYAAPIFFFTAYLLALGNYLQSRNSKLWWIIVPLLLLSIRSHSAGFALLPSLVYAGMAAWAGDNVHRKAWLRWKRGGAIILGGAMALGIAGYVIVFQSGNDAIATSSKAGNMFLTPLGDATQDNAYYVLAPWHLWDYVQVLLLGGAAAWVVVIGQWISRKIRLRTDPDADDPNDGNAAPTQKSGLQENPAVVGLGISAILLLALYFVIDPLLTMPRDWDLFILTAPPILVLALVAIRKMPTGPWWLNSLLLSVALLQAAFIPVNHDRDRVHDRQLDVARYVFRSGDVGGAFLIRHAIDRLRITPQQRIARLEAELLRLQPLQTKENKADFAYLHQYGGSTCFTLKDYACALRHYETQNSLVPNDLMTLEDLAVTAYYAQQFPQALSYSREAAALGSRKSSNWVLGFVTASALNQPRIALQIGDEYLNRFGDPDGIRPQIEALRQQLAP